MSLAGRKPARKKPAAAVQALPEPRALLAWYDNHRRVLPWRAPRGERSDPYRVWLSEIMLQQTTVRAVAPYYAKFLKAWPNVRALAKAPLENVLKAWAGLGYYARARNLHACAKAVTEKFGGKFPESETALRELPGIGGYTAAAMMAIAFDRPALPIDGNVERVVSRLFAIEEELPGAKAKLETLSRTLLPGRRYGDFAQALMDLGAMICTPKKPACVLCPWSGSCAAYARGDQETFPRKPARREGEVRKGAAFVALRADGRILLRKRADKGLLGGMSEVPGSEWSADFEAARAQAAAPRLAAKIAWRRRAGVVNHVFTHFPLELTVFVGAVPKKTAAPQGARWARLADVAQEALPNVMRKVIAHALEDFALQGSALSEGGGNGRRRAR